MSALILPLIFYITLIIFDKIIGVNSLAFAKVITVILGCSITFYGLYGIAGRRIIFTYLRCFIKILFPLIILSIFYFLFPPVENVITKSTNAFFQLFIHIVPAILFPLIAYYLLDKQIVSFIRDKINVKIKLISI
jgi:hypothetical protein